MKTAAQRVSLLFGLVLFLYGGLGMWFASKSMIVEPLFGFFRVNLVANLVHLVFGLWGLVTAWRFAPAKLFTKVAGGVFLFLALAGFFLPTGFGKVPLGGHNIWLHAIIGLALSYVGFGDAVLEDDGVIIE